MIRLLRQIAPRQLCTLGSDLSVKKVLLEKRFVDGAEGITNPRPKLTHNRDHDDGDQSEDDGILNQTLTFFFRCEQHVFLLYATAMFLFTSNVDGKP